MLECVVNVSEGRREAVVEAIAASADDSLLDVHTDSDHNRSVLTLAGADVERATRAVVGEAVRRIDLRHHVGVHPRLGAADVAPFVPVATGPGPQPLEEAMAARGRLAVWAADTLGLPVFLYGPERPLPEVRRHAFAALAPDFGPDVAHPTAGALCAGARSVLVAYNLWLAGGAGAEVARAVAAEMRRRRPGLVRAIGLDLGGRGQVSMNLVEPFSYGPAPRGAGSRR